MGDREVAMKVWVVFSEDTPQYQFIGVFKTKEDALNYVLGHYDRVDQGRAKICESPDEAEVFISYSSWAIREEQVR